MPLIKKIADITGYDIDYLTGATDHTNVLTNDTNEISIYWYESDSHFRTRFEELCFKHNVNKENSLDTLHITPKNFINICWNRMPALSELPWIAYSFNVSTDYLIGKTDTPFSGLSDDELDLILNYRDCLAVYKKNIRERAADLSTKSLKDFSVAADEPLKKTGTENQGK